jgi:drug/metabolite transporter superfamily protein YnfA
MKTYHQKVGRRVRWWSISTALAIVVMLVFGYAFLSLVDDVVNQIVYLELIGGAFIVVSLFLGQLIERILVRSWDTWIGDLGPTQISVVVQELLKQREKLEREEKGLDTRK